MQGQGIHDHIHKRKRVNLLKQDYPHPNKYIHLLDDICLIFSILMPLTTAPQIYKIFHTQNVEGLSLLMWIFYCFAVIPFLIYGIVHKEKPLIVLNSLWFVAQLIIIYGILLYS